MMPLDEKVVFFAPVGAHFWLSNCAIKSFYLKTRRIHLRLQYHYLLQAL